MTIESDIAEARQTAYKHNLGDTYFMIKSAEEGKNVYKDSLQDLSKAAELLRWTGGGIRK